MKTARITPIATNNHTIAAEFITEDGFIGDAIPNLLYEFRRGIADKLELGFNVELITPTLRIGGKYGFTRWCALDMNVGMSTELQIGDNAFDLYPVADVALIFGEKGLYGGIKYELFADGGSYPQEGAIHPFLGYEIATWGNVRILPELSIGSIAIDYHPWGLQPGNFVWFAGIGVAF